jgi:translation initiation factor IF-1
MSGEGAFVIEGLVIEAVPNGTFTVELANGHRLLGYLAMRDKPLSRVMAAGSRVRLKVSPCDLSKGRIIGIAEK